MAGILYSLVLRGNPMKKLDPKKWYGRAVGRSEATFDELCDRVVGSSSATKGDVQLVIANLLTEISMALANGQIVRMGDFGTFQMGISGEGRIDPKEFHTGLIHRAKINFRPGDMLTRMCKSARYEMSNPKTWSLNPFTPEEEPGI